MPKILLFLLFCATPATFAANAQARSASSITTEGEKVAQPKLSSHGELRACMDGDEEIKQRNAQLERRHTLHTSELKALQDQGTAFYASEDKVDTHDEKQVATFNARVSEINLQVSALNERGADLTEEVKRFRADMRIHNQRCAALVYKTIDRDAIVRERKNGKTGARE